MIKKCSGQLQEALSKITKFVLENKEIVKEIYKLPLYNDEPKIFNYCSKYETKYKNAFDVASGVSFNQDLALIRVLGETIERYSINKYKPKTLARKTVSQIESLGDYLNPIDLSPFSQKQLRKRSFRQFKIESNSIFNWTKAFSISKKKKILIPCQIASFNYDRIKGEPSILPIISTGTAFGITFKDALYRALCEVIERDAFMISYLNKFPSPKINLKSLKDREINKILGILERYKLEIFVLDLTTDIQIPVFSAIIIDRTGLGPAISIGLKAGFEIKENIIGAIEEALMARSWIRDKFVYLDPKYKKSKVIISLEQRAYLWFPIEMIRKLNFWLDKKESIKITLTRKKFNFLENALKILEKNGMNVIYKDITPEKVKRSGFIVLRVIIPEMQVLYLDERFKFLGNKRLYEVPVKLKYLKKKKSEADLNNIPHPFL